MIPIRAGLCLALSLAACTADTTAKLDALALTDDTRAALLRLRFAPLRSGDRVEAGDLILCGGGDRVLLAFPERLMVEYLGIDAGFIAPELFGHRSETELFLEVPASELMRLFIPPGIGATAPHPEGRVREVSGTPRWSGDLRTIEGLFDERQIFAHPTPGATTKTPTPSPEPVPATPRRLGISPFPRMGPKTGIVIERVLTGGPAERARLEAGDRIVAVNGQKVGDIYELKAAVETSRGPLVVLSVRRRASRATQMVNVSFE